MRTLTIPEERWPSFFQLFNRLAHERPARVEVVGRPLGDQEMASLRPFQALELETKGSERGSLTLTLGSDADEHTHRVVRPTHVYVAENDAGVIEWLAIIEDGGESGESGEAGEAKTLVHFEDLPALEAEFPDAR